MTDWEQMLDRRIQLVIHERNDFDGHHLAAKPTFTARFMNYE